MKAAHPLAHLESERVIADAKAKAAGREYACAAGALAVFCIDAAADDWSCAVVTDTDDYGVAIAVRDPKNKRVAIRSVKAGEVVMIVAASRLQPAAFAELPWKVFKGLKEAQAAASAYRADQ